MTMCTYHECDRDAYGKTGLCNAHYQQKRRGGELKDLRNPSLEARDDEGRKFCSKCLQWLGLSSFNMNAAMPDGVNNFCRECHWSSNLWTKYKIRGERYHEMLTAQGGACAICGTPPTDRRLVVDHDHACCPSRARSCGACVRALLCPTCNAGLGHFGDNADILRAAADYLDTHQ